MSAELSIEELLTRHLGLEIKSVGSRSILAGIHNRAKARRCDLDTYATLVAAEPTELAALVDQVIVPESWFMRDRVPFTNLAEHARAVLRNRPGKFRVLSAPCSTGEEPYSVVMAMIDAGIVPSQLVVDGIDVSPPLLETARRGVYRSMSFRGGDLGFRTRYFDDTTTADGTRAWLLTEVVRGCVQFRQANVLALGLIATEGQYDAILCRNLLIYLTAEARRVALGSLERVLAPDGLLITGHAESLEILDPRFRAIRLTGAFTYRRRGERAADKPALPTSQRITRPIVVLTSAEGTPALVPPPARDLLGEATALADRGELERAAELCDEHLLAAGADARAWTLLGTIRHAGGERERAEECFTRALYCDPANQTALVQLALLLERKGDSTGAANLRRRAAKASEDSR